MTVIAVDGLSEEDFRRSIEIRLREGKPAVALERIRRLLADFAGPGKILPERFLTVEAKDLVLRGWQQLGPAIERHDRPGRPITALSIAFGWPGEDLPQPDADGCLSPHIEVGYFNDDAYPFSHSARDDLLDGYSFHGCTWAADCEATDSAMSLEGIDDLHGALATLEAKLLASETPDPDEILAGSLGACLLSVLLFETVSARIERDGLPRPLCVMAGSNGVYPYFDAPVAGFPEEARQAADAEEEEAAISTAIPAPRYSSLLLTGVPRGTKRAVLVLKETEAETAARFANLRDQSHIEADSGSLSPELPVEPIQPEPEIAAAAESPLLAKKQPGKAWDFRDMLTPREPGSPAAEREEIDWDDWSDPPPPSAGEAAKGLESEPIDWNKPFAASQPLGFEPPAAEPEPIDWDDAPATQEPAAGFVPPEPVEAALPPDFEPFDLAASPSDPEPSDWGDAPEVLEPVAEFDPPEPGDWPEPPLSLAAEEAQEPGSIDWGEVPEAVLTPDFEPLTVEPPSIVAEPVDWSEAQLPSVEAKAQAFESGSSDWAGSSEASEPVDWPEAPLPPTDEELRARAFAPIDWGTPPESPPRGFDAATDEAEAVDWPDHLPKPGFALLEPVLAAPVSISYEPLPPLELTEPEPEPESEPEPIAVDPRDLPIPDWPLGLSWLEDYQEAAHAEPAATLVRPSLWDRLRAWLGR